MASLPMHSVGAELGVFAGEFSAEIVNIVRPSCLYLVDTFEGVVCAGYGENWKPSRRVDMSLMQAILRKRFDDAPVVVVKNDSIVWLQETAQLSTVLNWVYIDTTHEYEQTARELEAARAAVESNGWICGHDFSYPEVSRAVSEFCERHSLTVEVTTAAELPSFKIKNVVLK